MEKIVEIINNENVANVFFNLYERWLDEWKYEDINEYGKVLSDAINKEGANATLLESTDEPFGVKIEINGIRYHIYIEEKGDDSIVLCSRRLPTA